MCRSKRYSLSWKLKLAGRRELKRRMNIIVDKEFESLIPPLSEEERTQLEQNLIEHGGARDPLVVWPMAEWKPEGAITTLRYDEANKTDAPEWDNPYRQIISWESDDEDEEYYEYYEDEWPKILLDGHNRYEICTRLNLDYETCELEFDSREEAKDWIDKNQLGRRNLNPDAFTMLLGRRYNRLKKNVGKPSASNEEKFSSLRQRTSEILAKEHGVTDRTVRTAGQFAESVEKLKSIDSEIEEKVNRGIAQPKRAIMKAAKLLENKPEESLKILSGAKKMSEVIQEEKKEELAKNLKEVAAREAIEPTGLYDVIVIDPPWPMTKIERDVAPNQVGFDYPTMAEEQMANLQIPADVNCHVWLWTTHKFLPMAFRLLDTWKLKYVCCFTWHKPGGFQPFNLPQYNCEFALYARKGAPQFLETKSFPVCFEAPRSGHSAKPQAFYDFINRVTGGRRLDMFNRRAIEGFDVWGKEASNLK